MPWLFGGKLNKSKVAAAAAALLRVLRGSCNVLKLCVVEDCVERRRARAFALTIHSLFYLEQKALSVDTKGLRFKQNARVRCTGQET